jgi:hypothetical protein
MGISPTTSPEDDKKAIAEDWPGTASEDVPEEDRLAWLPLESPPSDEWVLGARAPPSLQENKARAKRDAKKDFISVLFSI